MPDAVWRKRLFMAADPALPSIPHVRQAASPVGRYVLAFCDWLTAHPAECERYEQVKRALAAQQAKDADYDDCTRAKTARLDEVQPLFEAWWSARRWNLDLRRSGRTGSVEGRLRPVAEEVPDTCSLRSGNQLT